MQITPDKLQFLLVINSISVDITNNVVNWEDIKIDYTRDDLKGAYIDVTNSIDFDGEAYTLLDNLYTNNSFNTNAIFVINLRNDVLNGSNSLWTYTELKRVDLDFSTFKKTDYIISLNAKSNSLADLIKANKGTVYDIPVSTLEPSYFYYDRLETFDEYYFSLIPDENNYISCANPTTKSIQLSMDRSSENYLYGNIEQSDNLNTINILKDGKYSFKGTSNFLITGGDNKVGATFYIKHHRNSVITTLYSSTSVDGEITVNFDIQDYDMLEGDYIDVLLDVYNINISNPGPSSVLINFSNNSKFIFYYKVRRVPISIQVVTIKKILDALLSRIAGNGYTSTLDIGITNDVRLASAESIRGFYNAKFHTSFDEFYNSMRAVFGLEYDIVGTTINFKTRDNLFKDSQAILIEDITDLNVSVNTPHIYSSLKIGFKKVDYNKVNGKDEFRFTNEFSTGVTVSSKKLELISSYRSDAWGIEFLSQSRGEDTTDDESDNDVFFLDCATLGSNLTPSRTIPITGVISPTTMFNVIFSPRQCLLRNSSYLGVSSNLYKFASSEGLSSIAINGVYENSNVTISNKLFLPDLIEFKVGKISALPAEKNGYVEFVYNGITYQGYIKELNHFIGKDQETTWTLFCKQKAVIPLMYINSDKDVITDIDTSTTFNINDNAELEVTQYTGDTDDYTLNENGELILIY